MTEVRKGVGSLGRLQFIEHSTRGKKVPQRKSYVSVQNETEQLKSVRFSTISAKLNTNIEKDEKSFTLTRTIVGFFCLILSYLLNAAIDKFDSISLVQLFYKILA